MYAAVFGDQKFCYTVEAIRLTWDGRRQAAPDQIEFSLRLSRLFDTSALGFSFDFDFRGDDSATTLFITRAQTDPVRPMAVSTGQLLMLDRFPAISIETPPDRRTFERWASNDRQSAARLAIKSFKATPTTFQEAVLPWLRAIVLASKTAVTASIPVRIIISARPCSATAATAAHVAAISADSRLSEKLPADLLRLLRKRIFSIPELAFIVEVTVATSSSEDLATLDRIYRDSVSGKVGLPNASTLEAIEAPPTLVSALTLHPTYFSPKSSPEEDLLSRGVSRGELVSAVSELISEMETALRNRVSYPAALADVMPAGDGEATIRPRFDEHYYRLPLPSKTRDKFVFVSYRQSNIAELSTVLENLKKDGFDFWYDRGIALADEWDKEIEAQITNCTAFLGLLSNAYFTSKNCRRELRFADSIGKRIIVVACEPLRPEGGLGLMLSSMQVGFLRDPMIRTFVANALNRPAASEK